MTYKVKLKTGFYQTTAYDLLISPGLIRLIPMGDAGLVKIQEEDVTAIMLTLKKHSGFEIQTRNRAFNGVLLQDIDLEELKREMKKNINKKIVYEES